MTTIAQLAAENLARHTVKWLPGTVPAVQLYEDDILGDDAHITRVFFGATHVTVHAIRQDGHIVKRRYLNGKRVAVLACEIDGKVNDHRVQLTEATVKTEPAKAKPAKTERPLTRRMQTVLDLIEARQAIMDSDGSGWWEPRRNVYHQLNGYGPSISALRKRGLIRKSAKFGWYSVAMIDRDHDAALDEYAAWTHARYIATGLDVDFAAANAADRAVCRADHGMTVTAAWFHNVDHDEANALAKTLVNT